jgi:phosphatidylinositol alpha-1,6-mannosyltransferase
MLGAVRLPRVMLAAESLRRGASGIGRVARLVARVLADEVRAGRLEAHALALNDPGPVTDLGLEVRTARGSRPRFVAEVHAAAARSDAFIYDFAGMARAHPRLWPLVRPQLVWIHGIEIWEDARADHLARVQAARQILANSTYTRARATALHAGLAHARVCWLATEETEPGPGPAFVGEPTVLILSRLDEGGGYKGHRELIDSWPNIVARVPDARLLIGGDGPGRGTIEGWVRSSPVRERIDMLGFVPEAQLNPLYRRSWLFAMPSRGEGFGIAYIEAMRHGLPVLGSVHDAAREVNLHGETGINVDLDVPGLLGDEVARLLTSPELLQRLGAAGRERWLAHFRYPAFAQRFLPELGALLRG